MNENNFDEIQASKVTGTIDILAKRIEERFPGSNLAQVCDKLRQVSCEAEAKAAEIQGSKPATHTRFAIVLLIALLLIVAIIIASYFDDRSDILQLIDIIITFFIAAIGVASYFWYYDRHERRKKVLPELNRLRNIAHVVDIHQLKKDPSRLYWIKDHSENENRLPPKETARYLEYCSEMYSLIGKIAAFYGQQTDDAVIISGVNEIELFTTGLSRKTWQKLIVMQDSQLKTP